MTLAICFWILLLLWFVLHLCTGPSPTWRTSGPSVLLFLLLLVLGWGVFGAPIRG